MRAAPWLFAFAMALVLPLGSVRAQPEPELGSLPQRQFEEARRHFYSGDYEMALQMFQLAWGQSKSPNARLYIGRCFHKLGKLRAAYSELTGTLRDATLTGDPRYDQARTAAAAELALVEPRIGKIVVALEEPVADARVTLDGLPLPAAQLGDPIAVFPGTVRVVARAPGRKLVVREAPVPAGKTVVVAIRLVPVAESAARPPPPSERDLSGVQIAGIVVASTGLAALIVAAATGAAAGSRFNTLEDICGPEPCTDPSFAEVIDSGKTYEKVAYISLAVGGAALLAGGAMILFGGQDQVTVTPLPNGAMLGYHRRF